MAPPGDRSSSPAEEPSAAIAAWAASAAFVPARSWAIAWSLFFATAGSLSPFAAFTASSPFASTPVIFAATLSSRAFVVPFSRTAAR